jgi:two-component system, sporulation sensor kinase A
MPIKGVRRMQTPEAFISALDECRDFVTIMKVEQAGVYTYYYANQFALEIGNIRESDYGKKLDEVIHSTRANYLKDKYNESILKNNIVLLDRTVYLQNGNILGEAFVKPVFGEDGVCTHLAIVAKNITDKKIKEEELFRANKMLDSFIDSSADGIIVLDYDNRITRVNHAFLEIFGYKKEDILFLKPTQWQNEQDSRDFLNILQYIKQGKELRNYETKRSRKDGTEIVLSVTYSPNRSSDGKIIGVICSVRDISERKQIIEKLENSNEKYELITKNMSDIIIIINDEGKIKYISPSCQNILKYEVVDLIDKTCFQFVHSDDLDEVLYRFKNILKRKNHDPFEFRIQHFNQKYIWFEVKTTTVLNSVGELDHIVLVARDITNRKLAEKELHKSREKYNLVSQHTSDLIKMYGLDGIIHFASPSHQEMLGYPPNEIEGKNIFDYIHPDDNQKTKEELEEAVNKKVPMLIQKRLKSALNEWVTVESIITPIVNENGTIESFVGVSRNVTDRLKNDELIRNLDRLSIIGQLAAGVAHEIRNPLTALMGFSKLMQSTSMDTDQHRYIKIMLDELERIELIVNEFMSLAKPQAIEFQVANIQNLINGTITVFETQALLHNVIIESTFSQKEPIVICCQPNQIKQVFMNIIKNAIEAMSYGGRINVSLTVKEENTVEVCFIDNGVGIPEDRLKHLGTPFYTTKEKGIGLGLTISNKIIKEHGGEMVIHSIPNLGTTVEVTLPILIKSPII